VKEKIVHIFARNIAKGHFMQNARISLMGESSVGRIRTKLTLKLRNRTMTLISFNKRSILDFLAANAMIIKLCVKFASKLMYIFPKKPPKRRKK
jgi:hypothetical protein